MLDNCRDNTQMLSLILDKVVKFSGILSPTIKFGVLTDIILKFTEIVSIKQIVFNKINTFIYNLGLNVTEDIRDKFY